MFIILKKTYTISVTIQEGEDEFWQELRQKSGCDEVLAEVRQCLDKHGFTAASGCHIRLERFELERFKETAPVDYSFTDSR